MLRVLPSITLAFVLTAAGAVAQEPVAESDESAEPETSQPAQSGAAAPAGDESPFDYESSEEISEDLSVSFPVDI